LPRILIVDDAIENIRLLKNLLQDFGEVMFARDGHEALALASEHRPDLVLLDVMMPGMDGYETCRRLKASPATSETRVIFVTGADAESDEAQGLALGAIDYITKPFAPAIVRARVQNQLALIHAYSELRRLAVTDPLTGVANRRRLMEVGDSEMARAGRSTEPVAVLMLDIDHFKRVNDTWGHPAGDAVIQHLASTAAALVRASDTVGRLGGEEFAIVLPTAAAAGAAEFAERLRTRIASTPVEWQGARIPITISVGVAERNLTRDADFSALLGRADQALYRAKSSGRNKVVTDLPDASPPSGA
jgi:diguanylate cyclase (GGDEF)-like protein